MKAVAFLLANARNSSAALPLRSASVVAAQHSSMRSFVVLRSLAAARGVVWASAIADMISAARLHNVLSLEVGLIFVNCLSLGLQLAQASRRLP